MNRRVAVASSLVAMTGLGGLMVARRAAPAAREPALSEAMGRDRAIDYFEAALARDPRNPALKGQLISRLVLRFGATAELADLVRAETLAATALDLAPDRSAALARLSGVQLMQHKFGDALENASRAVAADSGSSEARGVLLEAAIAAGRYRIADAQAARLDPSTVSGQVRRAAWLDARGQTAVAVSMVTQACRELERSAAEPQAVAWCQTQLAGMIHNLRGPEEAERLLRRVLSRNPGYRGAVEGLANLALADGRVEEAITRYRSILSNAHPDLFLRLADAYRLAGKPDSAAAAEERFLSVAALPVNETLFGNVLALYYAEAGGRAGLETALAVARREVDRRPTAESFDLLAWVHYRRGEVKAAGAASDRSLGWGSATPTMLYHRGRILAALGRRREGLRMVEQAVATPTLLAPHAWREWRTQARKNPDRGPA
jgi:tetratricopeptide (TPR) repeat protein